MTAFSNEVSYKRSAILTRHYLHSYYISPGDTDSERTLVFEYQSLLEVDRSGKSATKVTVYNLK